MQLDEEDEEQTVSNKRPEIEYTIEEGIRGFVKIDTHDGTLKLDSKLIDDSYEQIRFAAQAKRDGKTLVCSFLMEGFVKKSLKRKKQTQEKLLII